MKKRSTCETFAAVKCAWAMLIVLAGTIQSHAQLVMPGDHPDPSVVKIGDSYWASSTTSNWMPVFPLMQSTDLVHWKTAGYVFNTLPAWADYYFWAPEISYDKGKVYIYYAAHKKGGNLCIGVASADRPEGPYKDHGPLVCQADGSIDAFPMRDEKGRLHLVWKEDGNSVHQPTPIWIQEMNEERTALIGEKKELFRNDRSWEGSLVEGVSMLRHGDYFYAFYAAAGCCGGDCNYAAGVARAKSLMGPWEKYERNPVLVSEGGWRCPGHGTAVEKDGRYYFLYHAYNDKSTVYTGRQGLLKEFRFTADGWIQFDPAPTASRPVLPAIKDGFDGGKLSADWAWSVFQPMRQRLGRGGLELYALPAPAGSFLGRAPLQTDYTASTTIDRINTGAAAGIALLGDEKNTISALVNRGQVQVVVLKDGKETVRRSYPLSAGRLACLQMRVRNGKEISFYCGSSVKAMQLLNAEPLDGSFLPPWDRAPRIGLVAKGAATQKGVFRDFSIDYTR